MKDKSEILLSDLIDLQDTKAVFASVKKMFYYHYPKKYFKEVEKCHKQIKALFEGKYSGYNACNTKYHDLRHTMDVLLASSRLIDGYNLKENRLPERLAINLLKASLFHDTGYIQEEWDTEGTGAKHALNHVGRSIAFILKNRDNFELANEDIDSVSKMIRCTEIKCRLSSIPFSSEEEKTAGLMLGSADILGQMSDREYLERLLFLYNEMKEAGLQGYNTEFDIIKNTLAFYKTIKGKLNNSFKKVYAFAEIHFNERGSINKNLYIEAIEKNIAYIERIINDSTTNFRHKLKRGNIIKENVLSVTNEIFS